MPLQNRVTPTGAIVAHPARGLFTGNRGILHDEHRRLGAARWRTKAWIVCRLEWKGVRRSVMSLGTWTELFFLDEAVALAAGHRPCAYCRRDAFNAYVAAWARGNRWLRGPQAREIDAVAHTERIEPRTRRQVTHIATLDGLPDATFVTLADRPDAPLLVLGPALLPWTFDGYGAAVGRPRGAAVTVLTPRSTVAALAAGYAPVLHPSADAIAGGRGETPSSGP
jgi:hypothetical protein